MRYVPALDGLRGFSALLVVFFHCLLLGFGWAGVQIFFVLSGFLITQILLQEREITERSYFGRFYWRRAVRIFPLYFFYIGIVLLFSSFTSGEAVEENLFLLLTYTYNFSRLSAAWELDHSILHLWSLAIEEQFYLVWPFVVYFLSRRSLRRLTAALIIIAPIIRYLFAELIQDSLPGLGDHGEAVYWFTLSHLDAFAAGAAISLFHLDKSVKKPGRMVVTSLCLVMTLGLVNLALHDLSGETLAYWTFGLPAGGLENYQHVWSYTALNLFSASLIIFLLQQDRPRTFFDWKLFRGLGKISYGIYVYHMLFVAIYLKLWQVSSVSGRFGMLAFCLPLTIAAAALSYRFLELPFLRMKDRFFADEERSHRTIESQDKMQPQTAP